MDIGKKITDIPQNFNLHKTLKKIFDLRAQAIKNGKAIDWSTAESLAFGTLLTEGFSVRLSGQDSGRGTLAKDMLFFEIKKTIKDTFHQIIF